MPLTSMTGFGRAEGQFENGENVLRFHWEVRSVNGKALDARFRMPPGFDALEARLREELGRHLKRGNCQATLTMEQAGGTAPLRVNREALAAVLDAISQLQSGRELAPPSPEGILGLKGVLETGEARQSEEQREALEKILVATFAKAAAELARARREEGAKLEAMLKGQIDEVERLTAAASKSPSASLEAMKARIRTQVAELLGAAPALSEERLAQEAAVLATKADVREELDRLSAHISQARELFATRDPVGRRLDFLTQEFNREANTLCSKAADVALTRIGLDLKVVIDQFREQIQNVE